MSKVIGTVAGIVAGGLLALTGVGLAVDAVAFAGVGAASLGLGTVGIGTALGVAAAGASIGANALLSRTSSRPSLGQQTPSLGAPPLPLRQTIRQSNAPRVLTFGRVKHSGVFFVVESNGGAHLVYGIYICDGPIDGFDAIICDDEVTSYTQLNNNYAGGSPCNVYYPNSGIKFKSNSSSTLAGLFGCAYVGIEPINATQAGYASVLLTYLADNTDGTTLGTIWDNTRLGKGSSNATNGDRPKYFPNGFPAFSFVYRGARVYDPRDATQTLLNGGVWDIYNTTWKWSENPALIAAHYIMWLISQGLTAMPGVNWTDIATAANDCEALVSATYNIFGGGAAQEPFARMSAIIPFDAAPRDVLAKIMASCDGIYDIDESGLFTMWIGKWEDPSVVFTENDIGSFSEEFAETTTDAINEVASTYVEPRMSYAKYAAPTYVDLVSQSQVGKRPSTIDYEYVTSPNQAYRLTARAVKRLAGKRKITLTLGPRGILALRQRVIGFNTPTFNLPAVCRVEKLEPSGNLATWSAVVREVTADIYADVPAPVDPVSTLTIINAASLTAPSVVNISSQADAANSQNGYVLLSLDVNTNSPINGVPGLNLSALVSDQTLTMDGRWSYDNATWQPMTILLSQWALRGPSVKRGTLIYAQARFIGLNGTTGPWSSSVSTYA